MSYRRLFTQKLPLCQGVFICFVLLFKEFWLTLVLNKECVFKLNIFFLKIYSIFFPFPLFCRWFLMSLG